MAVIEIFGESMDECVGFRIIPDLNKDDGRYMTYMNFLAQFVQEHQHDNTIAIDLMLDESRQAFFIGVRRKDLPNLADVIRKEVTQFSPANSTGGPIPEPIPNDDNLC